MKKIDIGKKILIENEKHAFENILFLNERKKLCLNMISSPGSGKTTILVRMISDLKGKIKVGVIEGDIQTDIDAERIRATEAPAIQINTEGACHLSAPQISRALKQLPVDDLDLILIENVGNLVCPSAFQLGEAGKIVVLSVAEGDDKPVKYPAIFAKSKVLLINKIDLLAGGHVDFNLEKVIADARKLNKDIKIFPISAKTGQGMDDWYKWLLKSIETNSMSQ
ncbi:MAG: hydrogenase nickel incorporation protein HypB [Planctomycetes bacterium]|nr:hydrogenase nickel incorporation protein HypB [Planctomycetota bacterium]MBL7144871.1 hydrogenase nickel incorporation protein HypB [Phycisphaerae bacterium]